MARSYKRDSRGRFKGGGGQSKAATKRVSIHSANGLTYRTSQKRSRVVLHSNANGGIRLARSKMITTTDVSRRSKLVGYTDTWQSKKTGKHIVENVYVAPSHRKQGIASQMLAQQGKRVGGTNKLTASAYRSAQGEGLVRATGTKHSVLTAKAQKKSKRITSNMDAALGMRRSIRRDEYKSYKKSTRKR